MNGHIKVCVCVCSYLHKSVYTKVNIGFENYHYQRVEGNQLNLFNNTNTLGKILCEDYW